MKIMNQLIKSPQVIFQKVKSIKLNGLKTSQANMSEFAFKCSNDMLAYYNTYKIKLLQKLMSTRIITKALPLTVKTEKTRRGEIT